MTREKKVRSNRRRGQGVPSKDQSKEDKMCHKLGKQLPVDVCKPMQIAFKLTYNRLFQCFGNC